MPEAHRSPFRRALSMTGSGIDEYLLNSVYGWACHDGLAGNDEVAGSERLIGWLTLLVKTHATVIHCDLFRHALPCQKPRGTRSQDGESFPASTRGADKICS